MAAHTAEITLRADSQQEHECPFLDKLTIDGPAPLTADYKGRYRVRSRASQGPQY